MVPRASPDVADGVPAGAMERPHHGFCLPTPALEAAFGLVFLGVALWLWFGSYAIQGSSKGAMGPAGFPRGIALLLGLSAVLLTSRGVRGVLAGATQRVSFGRPLPVLAAIVLVALYPLLLDWIGYYPLTALWLPALLYAAGYRRLIGVIGYTAGFLIFTRIVFQSILAVPMP